MQVSIAHFIFLVIGLLAGGLLAWLILKSRLALVKFLLTNSNALVESRD